MSPSGGRRALDFYPTPRWMTGHLAVRLKREMPNLMPCTGGAGPYRCSDFRGHAPNCRALQRARILEPSVGEGHIIRELEARFGQPVATLRNMLPAPAYFTNDLDRRHEAMTHYDATEHGFWDIYTQADTRPDWVITNPPFNAAFEIIRQAVATASVGVAMLLRVTWLEPPKSPEHRAKAEWLAANPPKWELVMERTSFDGAGQDSAPCAWFVWSPYLTPRIEVIPGRDPDQSQQSLWAEQAPGS